MNFKITRFITLLALSGLSLAVNASNSHTDEADSTQHHDSIHLTGQMAQAAGLKFESAGPGTIARTLTSYAKVVYDPSQVSHVRARFSGIIEQVTVNIGDTVKQGQVLAKIESNESLQTYQLKAPIAGRITKRHANPGELTQAKILFTIMDDSAQWLELKVFPTQIEKIKPGQQIRFQASTDGKWSSARIQHLLADESGQPYLIARAALTERHQQVFNGRVLKTYIQLSRTQVAVRVNNEALQQYEGKTVVFVREQDQIFARPVKLGLQDNAYSQIVHGLAPGEQYVSHNSYLVKADLGKSAAGHHH